MRTAKKQDMLVVGECECPPPAPPAPGWISLDLGHIAAESLAGGVMTFTNLDTAAQQRIDLAHFADPCFWLIPGRYRVAVNLVGHEPFRSVVQVVSGQQAQVRPELVKASAPAPTLHDILHELQVGELGVDPRDLTVPAGQTVVLTSDHPVYKSDWQPVTLANVDDAKRVIGISNATWGVDTARYGTAAYPFTPAASAERAAKEYIFGNSETVSEWKNHINNTIFNEAWTFALFTYGVVTINRGGVLRINDKSSFFICQKLRMHVTAKLDIRGKGPGLIWPAAYESFCGD
ncbi:hypothetical protein ACAG26_04105 [Mycobacterium sp. pUA109]|uniref:hypothetical protein n=1 Tax=Mycobacterium sp. pUA109 TaxID=3238982 RepID=UPI00351ACCDC